MRFKRTIFALAALMLSGTVTTIPAYAQADSKTQCICGDKCDADSINSDCVVCCRDYSACQGTEKAETEDEGNTAGTSPLTPEGNMTLVDDITTDPEDSSKQFFTVTSKDGHYFYIIIDRDSRGNNTVHFLNQVDEADLLGLMEEEDVKAYQAALDAAESKENSSKTSLIPEQEETEDEETEESTEKETEGKKETNQSRAPLAVGLVILCLMAAAGGIFWYSSHKGRKSDNEETEDPDADYREDEEYELSDEQEDGSEETQGSADDVTTETYEPDDTDPDDQDQV